MKNTRTLKKIFACLLACMLMVSLLATTASAASYGEDDKRIWVLDPEDGLHLIVPDESGNISIPSSSDEGVVVDQSMEYYYYTSESYPSTPWIEDSSASVPILVPDSSSFTVAEVFVNGVRVNSTSAYVSNGEAYITNYNDLYRLFPQETVDTYFPTAREETSLKSWADRYGYTYILNGTRVYLNNNNAKPVEVVLDGSTVSFPDQQPIILSGRTMIPLHTISSITGCSIEWDGAHNRIIINKDNSRVILWIDSTTYWVKNGTYPKGQYFTMDVAPQLVGGRTMVPLHLISSLYGYNITFDDSGAVSIVTMSSK